jgi:hypothetical protein
MPAVLDPVVSDARRALRDATKAASSLRRAMKTSQAQSPAIAKAVKGAAYERADDARRRTADAAGAVLGQWDHPRLAFTDRGVEVRRELAAAFKDRPFIAALAALGVGVFLGVTLTSARR